MRLRSRPRRNPSELFIINPHTPGRPRFKRRNPVHIGPNGSIRYETKKSWHARADAKNRTLSPARRAQNRKIAMKAAKTLIPLRKKRKAAPKKGKGKATMAKRRKRRAGKARKSPKRKSAKRVRAGKKAARTRARRSSAKRSRKPSRRKARRNPAPGRRRRRRNPVTTTSAYKSFGFVGRTSSGKRQKKSRRISKRRAHALLKKGEMLVVRSKRRGGKNKGWSAGSRRRALAASAPKRRRRKVGKKKRKAGKKKGHRKSAKRVAAGKKAAATRKRNRSGSVYGLKRGFGKRKKVSDRAQRLIGAYAARPNPRRRKARRNPKRGRRVARRNGGGSRLSMAMQGRRNPSISGVLADLKLIAPQIVAATVGFAVAMGLLPLVASKLPVALTSKIPAAIQPHVPALLCGALTVGLFAALSMAGAKGVNAANKIKGGVAIGGGVATLLLLAQSTGIASKLQSMLPSAGSPAAAAPALPGVAGMFRSGGMLSDYTSTGDYTNTGDYTSTGGMDDRSQFLSGADDLTQFGGMDDAAPFAPGEGGILSGKMF